MSQTWLRFLNWWCCRSAKRLRTFMFFDAHFVSEKTLVFQSYFSLPMRVRSKKSFNLLQLQTYLQTYRHAYINIFKYIHSWWALKIKIWHFPVMGSYCVQRNLSQLIEDRKKPVNSNCIWLGIFQKAWGFFQIMRIPIRMSKIAYYAKNYASRFGKGLATTNKKDQTGTVDA